MPGVALSETGRAQAAALGEHLARERLDRIACSPLERTHDTAAIVATACGLAGPSPTDALIEIDMGDWTGSAFDDLHGADWDAWNMHRGTARIPGGETMAEAQARIVGYMTEAAAAADDGARIALVTHSDMIRAAVAHAIGLDLDNLLRFDIGPASVSRVIVGDWGSRLVSLNEGVTA